MKKIVLYCSIISLLSAEPSAFGAGDLDSDNPYGLTKDEKYIWQNKQDIKKIYKLVSSNSKVIKSQQKEIAKLKLQILNYKMAMNSLSQRVEGIETILPFFDKLSIKVKQLKKELNKTETFANSMVKNLSDDITTLKDTFNSLKDIVNKNQESNSKNQDSIFALMEKLASKIDKIEDKLSKMEEKLKKSDFRNLPKSEILDKAVSNFKYKNYKKAKEMFLYLYSKKYKTATTLFYLGEIEYKRGVYKNALAYYKQSIKEYPKPTSFTAELLYHTGYSLEKLGKSGAAIKSYQKIINDFPDSIFVKYAKKRIDNLQKNK